MHRERLENVVRVLKSLPPEAPFNLLSWVGDLERGSDDWDSDYNGLIFREEDFPLIVEPMLIPHNCGCSACACGYAGLDPWFREQGFITTPRGTVTFGDAQSWQAVEAFFDLRASESHYLFSSGDQTSREDTIARIERFLTEGYPEWDDDDE